MKLLVPLRTLPHVVLPLSSTRNVCARRSHSSKVSEPLRILFCGSDDFSCESLRALHTEQQRNPELIESVDVLCRPGKRTGRSMKRIREVPIKAVAQELGLTIHERDTFTKWQLPKPQNEPIDLIIAVSFGLFVPPRVLRSAKFGGLNVHPSLLPNFRGPAPLQHTIMAKEERIGVTLQTLDESSFDHGIILAQTPYPGLAIPSPRTCTYQDLLQFIKPKAAEMLIAGLRNRVFVPPLVDVGQYAAKDIRHAPKTTPGDAKILWDEWDPETIHARHRALGRLWTTVMSHKNVETRIIFEDFELLSRPTANEFFSGEPKVSGHIAPFGTNVVYVADVQNEGAILVHVRNDKVSSSRETLDILRVREITVEGGKRKGAWKALAELGFSRDMYDLDASTKEF